MVEVVRVEESRAAMINQKVKAGSDKSKSSLLLDEEEYCTASLCFFPPVSVSISDVLII